MIKDIILKWESNNHFLEYYFRNTMQSEYTSYTDIVLKIFELCINVSTKKSDSFDIDRMTIIDDGEFQGTIIYVIPKDTYQPNIKEYIVIDTCYDSCSESDLLMSISCCDYNCLPNNDQVNSYMLVASSLVSGVRMLNSD